MKLENQLVSLKLAKELKKAGFPQDTYFVWNYNPPLIHLWQKMKVKEGIYDGDYVLQGEIITGKFYAAPTVAELGELLKNIAELPLHHGENKWVVNLIGYQRWGIETEADARAKMWLYLKKEKLL